MSTPTSWNGKPYYPISQYFRHRFGERVGKISVSVAEQCPNRSDSALLPPCIFCDEYGSAAYHLEREESLVEQIERNKRHVVRRLKCSKFLVYFQSYTNTLDKVEILKQRFSIAVAQESVCGLVVGTRPDCLPNRVIDLFNKVTNDNYLLVELGLQSFFDHHLQFLQRGHSVKQNIQSVATLVNETEADVGVHLIFGLPHEADQEIIETAQRINELSVNNVKLHNLHVFKNTPLAKLYQEENFTPVELDEYSDKVILFLRHLSPDISVQRLAAIANRRQDLIAPKWTEQKMVPIDFIDKKMCDSGYYQGQLIG